MIKIEKKNVKEFNQDVVKYGGYQYTTNGRFSSYIANLRLTDATSYGISKFTQNMSGAKVLDIGCGDGSYTKELSNRFENLEFSGFDPAKEAIDSASLKFPNIKFFVGNILESKSTKNIPTFDVGVVRGVLHHLSEPRLAIQNSAGMCKKVIIIEPNGYNPILKLIEKLSTYHRMHEEKSYFPFKLKQWIEEAGLRVVEQSYVGYVPFFFPTPLAKLIYAFQPALEKVPVVRHLFTACVVFYCESQRETKS